MQTWKVKVDSLPKLGVLKSPSFEVAGLVWFGLPSSVCVPVYASSPITST